MARARCALSDVISSAQFVLIGDVVAAGEAVLPYHAYDVHRRRRSNNVTSNNNLGRFGSEGAGCIKLCDIVDCSYEICKHDPIRFMRPMLQASFCLQPPSDTPTRRSTFDSIMVGCIPVFFEDSSAKAQYEWHLPEDQYKEFSVFIPNEDVVFKETRVLDVFRSIPRVRVRMMREKVLEMIPRVMYRRHGSSMGLRAKKDAFYLAIDGVLKKIKSRVPVQPRVFAH
ncbi:hypothetical protein EV2_038961 [Malus domestica]